MQGNIRSQLRNQQGLTYLMLMFVIVLIGISTTAAAKQWKVMVQRELEADLITKGIEIQNALALYSAAKKAGRVMPGEVYPQSLAELTRLPKPFLRKVYPDPMTDGDWEYLRAPTGGIMGVRSRSRSTPLRKHDFPQTIRHFEGRASYYDWVFQYPNPSSGGMFPQGQAAAQAGTTPIPIQGMPSAPGTTPSNGTNLNP